MTWKLENRPGTYRLYAWIPNPAQLNSLDKQDAGRAQYQWRNPGGQLQPLATIDQERSNNRFAYLGRATLGQNAEVFLGNAVGSPRVGAMWVLFDAIVAVPD